MNSHGSTTEEKHGAYKLFLDNVKEFRELDSLPVQLLFSDDVDAETLANQRASWHRNCHLKFNNDKLERAKKKLKNTIQQSTESQPPK